MSNEYRLDDDELEEILRASNIAGQREFTPHQVEKLRQQYLEMMERRSDATGSAYGEHYLLVGILREFGVTARFESSSQVENYVEHVIIYSIEPNIY